MTVAERAEELYACIRGCERCALAKTRTLAVPGEGPLDAEVLLIGEAPGVNEDKQGRPFVGQSGQFLDELLAAAGMSRRKVFICNVLKCRPPSNRDPLPDEIAACREAILMSRSRSIAPVDGRDAGPLFDGGATSLKTDDLAYSRTVAAINGRLLSCRCTTRPRRCTSRACATSSIRLRRLPFLRTCRRRIPSRTVQRTSRIPHGRAVRSTGSCSAKQQSNTANASI